MRLMGLSHSIKLEMLWELMRLYDWRIITYYSRLRDSSWFTATKTKTQTNRR